MHRLCMCHKPACVLAPSQRVCWAWQFRCPMPWPVSWLGQGMCWGREGGGGQLVQDVLWGDLQATCDPAPAAEHGDEDGNARRHSLGCSNVAPQDNPVGGGLALRLQVEFPYTKASRLHRGPLEAVSQEVAASPVVFSHALCCSWLVGRCS